jgi:lysophospholipase L1-like esterase
MWILALMLTLLTALLPAGRSGREPVCCAPPPVATLTATIMPLGDSITEGVGSSDGLGYRGRLDRLLKFRHAWVGSQSAAPWRHEGHSGWRIDQVIPYARGWAATYRPSVILVDLGTNDAGRGHDEPAAQMLAELQTLLAELRAGSPTSAIVVAQPTLTPLNTAAQQAALRDYGNALAALPGIRVVDMRGVHIGTDGVHPDDAGYADMARRWAKALPSRTN